jgi:hypothetical protein
LYDDDLQTCGSGSAGFFPGSQWPEKPLPMPTAQTCFQTINGTIDKTKNPNAGRGRPNKLSYCDNKLSLSENLPRLDLRVKKNIPIL